MLYHWCTGGIYCGSIASITVSSVSLFKVGFHREIEGNKKKLNDNSIKKQKKTNKKTKKGRNWNLIFGVSVLQAFVKMVSFVPFFRSVLHRRPVPQHLQFLLTVQVAAPVFPNGRWHVFPLSRRGKSWRKIPRSKGWGSPKEKHSCARSGWESREKNTSIRSGQKSKEKIFSPRSWGEC